jgi:hypothetical protein
MTRIVLLLFCGVLPGMAQWLHYPAPRVPRDADGSPDLKAPAPKMPDGKPDLSGMWSPGATRIMGTGKGFPNAAGQNLTSVFFDIAWGIPESVPYQSWAAELVKKRKAEEGRGTPDTKCLPLSLVQKDGGPGIVHVKKIVQTASLLIILYERNMEFRQIFLDGRPLPQDPNPAWNGYSVGHWEGDTLVVQTTGFRDGTWADFYGSPLTDAAKVTERFRRTNYGTLEVDLTVEDAKAYTRPWTVKIDSFLMPDTDLLEYVCLENERDSAHLPSK